MPLDLPDELPPTCTRPIRRIVSRASLGANGIDNGRKERTARASHIPTHTSTLLAILRFSRPLSSLPRRAPSSRILVSPHARPFTSTKKGLIDGTITEFGKGTNAGSGEKGSRGWRGLAQDALLTKGIAGLVVGAFGFYIEYRISGKLAPISLDLAETKTQLKGLSGEVHEVRSDLREVHSDLREYNMMLHKLSNQIGHINGRLSGTATNSAGAGNGPPARTLNTYTACLASPYPTRIIPASILPVSLALQQQLAFYPLDHLYAQACISLALSVSLDRITYNKQESELGANATTKE
ncbi:hypothetical protein JCM10296v2_006095 [Rhodotorula toruloides]